MNLDGFGTDIEPTSDLLVSESGDDEVHHLSFARRESGEAGAQFGTPGMFVQAIEIASRGVVSNGIDP